MGEYKYPRLGKKKFAMEEYSDEEEERIKKKMEEVGRVYIPDMSRVKKEIAKNIKEWREVGAIMENKAILELAKWLNSIWAAVSIVFKQGRLKWSFRYKLAEYIRYCLIEIILTAHDPVVKMEAIKLYADIFKVDFLQVLPSKGSKTFVSQHYVSNRLYEEKKNILKQIKKEVEKKAKETGKAELTPDILAKAFVVQKEYGDEEVLEGEDFGVELPPDELEEEDNKEEENEDSS